MQGRATRSTECHHVYAILLLLTKASNRTDVPALHHSIGASLKMCHARNVTGQMRNAIAHHETHCQRNQQSDMETAKSRILRPNITLRFRTVPLIGVVQG
jgi:hypothetical protein